MENHPKITLVIPRRCRDKRFDAALFAVLGKEFPEHDYSRGFAKRLIQDGYATLDGRKTKPSTPVHQDAIIEIDFSALAPANTTLRPNLDIAPAIIEETPDYVAIDKPAGLQVHPATHAAGNTLANWIIAAYPETASVGEDPLRPGIVHRLDRETSGIMMIAKTKKGFDELKHVFHDRLAEKTYIALVFGHMPELTGIIDQPIGQRSGELRRRSGKNVPGNAREAITHYRVIARYAGCDLIAAMPKTGRTHQIRVHMAALGHPIIGDALYASKPMRQPEALTAPRHMLHAWCLSLPLFSQTMSFQAPLPTDFKDVLSGVDETRDTRYDDEALESLFLS